MKNSLVRIFNLWRYVKLKTHPSQIFKMFRDLLKIRQVLYNMLFTKLLLEFVCITLVAGESPNLPRISFDLTIPLNKLLFGNILKSDFKNTLLSTNFFNNDTGSRETVTLLYAAGRNA